MKRLLALLLAWVMLYSPVLAIERNVASQFIEFTLLEDGEPKTGDAANLTAYVSIDGDTTPDALTDTSATELSSTNAPGVYRFDLTQGETNGKDIVYSVKSSTGTVKGVPRFVTTVPAGFSTLTIANNAVDADLERAAGSTTPVTNWNAVFNTDFATNYDTTNDRWVVGVAANAISDDQLHTNAVNEIRNAITGGAYDLDTDANGRIRIVDGTGTGELDTSSGEVALADTQGNVSFLEFAITEGLAVSTTDANESAATYTGNGTGHGTLYTSGSGATGDAVRMVAASTTGRGLAAWGTGAAGIDARGTTQGGPGVFIQSASTLANAVRVEGQANGYATVSIASAGTGADAAELFSSGANSAALTLRGGTTGFGDAIRLQPGASGIDVRTASVKAGTVGSTGNDDTHIHLSGLAGANDAWNGYGLVILDISASRSYFRTISDWVDSSDLAEVSSLGFTPVNTDIYWIFPPDTANMLASILGDTNELQTDWANGGRLDVILDAIKVITDKFEATTSEITGTPAGDADYFDMIRLQYQRMIYGGQQTASKKQVYDSGGAAEYEHDVSDNGTTYTESSANSP